MKADGERVRGSEWGSEAWEGGRERKREHAVQRF